MTSYVLNGRITKEHKLEVDVPADVLPGDAQVVLTVDQPHRGSGAAILALFRKWEEEPISWTPRSKEEVDAELNEMRDEWDRP